MGKKKLKRNITGLRNQPQKTTGSEKAIRDTGHECIFIPNFHCELNPIEIYWYRQVPKANLEQANRTAAINAFDACPADVICQFINWSWHFMSAHHVGLTGKAAARAVHKQKGHCAVS
ncbi:hypothetical protein AN958_12858 [Leucoagaricus sp. SymC.cos]|nr:hypothetical protein AN958_12858 [Leucoagaricus sp. SymC.cos]